MSTHRLLTSIQSSDSDSEEITSLIPHNEEETVSLIPFDSDTEEVVSHLSDLLRVRLSFDPEWNWDYNTDEEIITPPTPHIYPKMSAGDYPVFEGTQGEDPTEYIDDVELCAKDSFTGREPSADELDVKKRSVFRRGLRGDAREWYHHLDADTRRSWTKLQEGIRKRFPLRVRNRDLGLGARIDSFDRQAGESLAAYVSRANSLSLRASDSQLLKLRERLYRHMCSGGNQQDERIQERVTDRLVSGDLLSKFGEFNDTCTYQDVSDTIVACALKPGREGEFLDQVEMGMSKASKPLSQGDFLRDLKDTLNSTLQHFKDAQAVTPAPPAPPYIPPLFKTADIPQVHFAQLPGNSSLPPYNGAEKVFEPAPPPQEHHKHAGGRSHDQEPPMNLNRPIEPQPNPPPVLGNEPPRWQSGGYRGRGGGRGGRGGYAFQPRNNYGSNYGGNYGSQYRNNYGGNFGGSYSTPLICWNCGIEGHTAYACPKENRPYEERSRIRDAVLSGQPLPTDLNYDLPDIGPTRPTEARPVNTGMIVGTDGQAYSESEYLTEAEQELMYGNENLKDILPVMNACYTPPLPKGADHTIAMPAEKRKMGPRGSPVDPLTRAPEASAKDKGKGKEVPPVYPPESSRKGKEREMPRPSSPSFRRAAPDPSRPNEKLRDELNKRLIEARRQIAKQDTIPIRAFENHREDRIDIGELLRTTPFPTITWGQLLDRSPAIRAQLTKEMGLSPKAKLERPRRFQKRKGHHSAAARVGQTGRDMELLPAMMARTMTDRARVDDGRTHLGYITGEIFGKQINRCLIDGGSLSELISPECAMENDLIFRPVPRPLVLKMADDSTTAIDHYVVCPLMVEGILTVIRAYVTGRNQTYNILLGKGWLRRNSAVIDFATDLLTLKGIEGKTASITMVDAPGGLVPNFKGTPVVEEVSASDTSSEEGDSDSDHQWDVEDDDDEDGDSMDGGPTNRDLIEEMVSIAELALTQVEDSKN